MSNELKLSHNELSALLKLVFQGLFGHAQDWGALAEQVAWLETHGFGGVDKMIDGIKTDAFRGFDGDISKSPDGLHIDFRNNSMLMGLPLLIDLALANAVSMGHCQINVSNALHFDSVIAVDAALRERGVEIFTDRQKTTITTQAHNEIKLFDLTAANEHYAQCLRKGVPMDQETYEYLNKLAEKTLVEATEASRRGAGE